MVGVTGAIVGWGGDALKFPWQLVTNETSEEAMNRNRDWRNEEKQNVIYGFFNCSAEDAEILQERGVTALLLINTPLQTDSFPNGNGCSSRWII